MNGQQFRTLKRRSQLNDNELAELTGSSERCIGMYLNGSSLVPAHVLKNVSNFIAFKEGRL